MKISKFIALICLGLLAGFQSNAQIVGVWELHAIDFEMTEAMFDQEFGEGDTFTTTDEATEIPETITFHEDGTCTLLFLAYYEEEEDDDDYLDDDDELKTSDIEVSGTWQLANGDIKITEEESGAVWYLTNVRMGDGTFTCGFSLLGFTWGIEMLEYGLEN